MKVMVKPVLFGAFGKRTGRTGSQRKHRDHPDNSIVENSQNTVKSPGYSNRLAATRTPVKEHQLTLV